MGFVFPSGCRLRRGDGRAEVPLLVLGVRLRHGRTFMKGGRSCCRRGIKEGDYIEIRHTGAYGRIRRTLQRVRRLRLRPSLLDEPVLTMYPPPDSQDGRRRAERRGRPGVGLEYLPADKLSRSLPRSMTGRARAIVISERSATAAAPRPGRRRSSRRPPARALRRRARMRALSRLGCGGLASPPSNPESMRRWGSLPTSSTGACRGQVPVRSGRASIRSPPAPSARSAARHPGLVVLQFDATRPARRLSGASAIPTPLPCAGCWTSRAFARLRRHPRGVQRGGEFYAANRDRIAIHWPRTRRLGHRGDREAAQGRPV